MPDVSAINVVSCYLVVAWTRRMHLGVFEVYEAYLSCVDSCAKTMYFYNNLDL